MTCPACSNARPCGGDAAWGSCIGCHASNRRPGPGCVYCPICIDECDENLDCLASNLEIGAALCAAFSQGQLAYNWTLFGQDAWRPGCGRSAP